MNFWHNIWIRFPAQHRIANTVCFGTDLHSYRTTTISHVGPTRDRLDLWPSCVVPHEAPPPDCLDLSWSWWVLRGGEIGGGLDYCVVNRGDFCCTRPAFASLCKTNTVFQIIVVWHSRPNVLPDSRSQLSECPATGPAPPKGTHRHI